MESDVSRFTIHGFSDFIVSRTKFERGFWFTAIVLDLLLMTYQLSGVVWEYRSDRVAVDISPEYVTEYPPIVYCPFNWIDRQKAARLNLTEEAYIYLDTLFIYGRLSRHISANYMHYFKNSTYYRKNFEIFFDKYKELYQNGSLRTLLFDHLSFHPETIFPNAFVQYEMSKINSVINQFGLCYEAKLPSHKTTFIYMVDMSITVNRSVNGFPERSFLKKHQIEPVNNLLVGAIATGTSPLQGHIIMNGQYVYQVQLKATRLVRRSTGQRRCGSFPTEEQYDRYSTCVNQYCKASNSCIYLQQVDVENSTSPYDLCSRINASICRPTPDVQKACWDDAPQPCNQFIVESSISVFPTVIPSDTMTIYISFGNSFNVLEIQENKLYTFVSFVSNVGGQMSLWCGASALSIIQLVYFFAKYISQNRVWGAQKGRTDLDLTDLQNIKVSFV